mmetsp:Transcript_57231/g.95097  ORF Transcript_57231/g.95097 Transcript_57231/m.95097 type:complete len:209 (+) Transcript_57231:1639-2265(+)
MVDVVVAEEDAVVVVDAVAAAEAIEVVTVSEVVVVATAVIVIVIVTVTEKRLRIDTVMTVTVAVAVTVATTTKKRLRRRKTGKWTALSMVVVVVVVDDVVGAAVALDRNEADLVAAVVRDSIKRNSQCMQRMVQIPTPRSRSRSLNHSLNRSHRRWMRVAVKRSNVNEARAQEKRSRKRMKPHHKQVLTPTIKTLCTTHAHTRNLYLQ